MPIFSLIEYSNNYRKTSNSLWQYCGDETDNYITDSESFIFKSILTNNTGNAGTVNVK